MLAPSVLPGNDDDDDDDDDGNADSDVGFLRVSNLICRRKSCIFDGLSLLDWIRGRSSRCHHTLFLTLHCDVTRDVTRDVHPKHQSPS